MLERLPSIRRTLLLYLGALFVGGTALLFVGARRYGRSAADLSYDRLLKAAALAMAENVARVDGSVRMDLPYVALEVLAMAPGEHVFYRVADLDGRTASGHSGLPVPPHRVASEQPVYFDAQYGGEPVRFAVLGRFLVEPAKSGWALVQVGQTRRGREALAREITLRAMVPIAALALIALTLIWFGVRHAMTPLARLEHELAARRPTELEPLRGPVPVELTHLVTGLNRFMGRLRVNMEALREFIGTAAHQMRTPLAAVRAQAQLALDDDDPQQHRRSLDAIERNAAHLSRLIEQLLSDAAVGHRAELRSFEELDLATIAQQAADHVLPQADSRPELRFRCDGDTRLPGDALMLGEAIKNLVDNALHHGGSERGVVELEVRGHVGLCTVSVSDRGAGIPTKDLNGVCDRFVRGKGARPGGAGLGLSIVQRVVASHEGRLHFENREGGGLTVRIELPRNCA